MQMQGCSRWAWGLAILVCLLAQQTSAQSGGGDARGLVAQLIKHYRLSTAKLTTNGAAGIEPRSILTVHREGIVGFAESDRAMTEICPSEFRGDELHAEKDTLCTLSTPKSRRAFRISETVCVTSISASEANDSVSVHLVSCSGGRAAVATRPYYALAVFRFPKGIVAKASAARIEETIDHVISAGGTTEPAVERPVEAQTKQPAKKTPTVPASQSVPEPPEQTVPPLAPLPPAADESKPAAVAEPPVESKPEQPAQTQPAIAPPPAVPEPAEQSVPPLPPLPPVQATPEQTTQQEQPHPADSDAPAQPPGAAAESPVPPAQLTTPTGGVVPGQTPEQVKAALGNPDAVIDLGAKFIYLYPHHLKIFFVDGKVSKVQQPEDNQ